MHFACLENNYVVYNMLGCKYVPDLLVVRTVSMQSVMFLGILGIRLDYIKYLTLRAKHATKVTHSLQRREFQRNLRSHSWSAVIVYTLNYGCDWHDAIKYDTPRKTKKKVMKK